MLKIKICDIEPRFNETTYDIISYPDITISLEHSLYAVQRWEAIWEKSFFTRDPKTDAETLSYIQCMTIPEEVPIVYYEELLSDASKTEIIQQYIQRPMSATKISDSASTKRTSSTQTSEIIYYQMLACGLPLECEHWHLNRLITQIEVISIKNNPNGSKMSKGEALARQRKINEQRRNALKVNKEEKL